MAGLDTRTSFSDWLDAVYATLIVTPDQFKMLETIENQMVLNSALADPEGARETWGLLPEHQIRTPLEGITPE